MPACFMASGFSPNLSTRLLNRWGMKDPESWMARSTWVALVMGMMPGSTGTVMPASRILYRKL